MKKKAIPTRALVLGLIIGLVLGLIIDLVIDGVIGYTTVDTIREV